LLESSVAIIDSKETELNMEGDVLEPATVSYRGEIKAYLARWYVTG